MPKPDKPARLASYLQPPTPRERAARAAIRGRASTSASADVVPAGRVIAYVRVSTADQAANGQSLATQQKQIEGWAMMKGLQLDQVVIEAGVSGGKEFATRPEGAKLWAALRRGDSLVAAKIDRLSRDLLDCLSICREFQEKGIKLYLLDINGGADPITGNGISGIVLSLLGAFAQFERERIGERIREVKRDQKARGEYLGGKAPFGWTFDADRKLVPVEKEQWALRRILDLNDEGYSSRAISSMLAADGFKLSHVSIQKIIARETPAA